MSGPTDREYFEALLHEKDRAIEMASDEREKAASALRSAMERLIVEGDDRLREHIINQFAQVSAALASSELLEQERIARVENAVTERINGVQRELTQALSAAETAVLKAEESDKDRFAAHNGLIAQMRSQAEASEATVAKLTADLLPRETFEAVVAGWTAWRDDVNRQLERTTGAAIATERREDRLQPWMIWAMGLTVTAVVVIVNLVAKIN